VAFKTTLLETIALEFHGFLASWLRSPDERKSAEALLGWNQKR
jgi:hypothetical protein